MTIPQDMIRPEIAGLPAYNAGLALDRFRDTYGIDCLAKLDSNENSHGASPHAVAAIELAAASVASYPDAVSLRLRRQVAAVFAVLKHHQIMHLMVTSVLLQVIKSDLMT